MDLTDVELKQLEEADNDENWSKIVDEIRSKRNGQYPPDWGEKILFNKNFSPKVDLSINIIQSGKD